MRQARCLGCKCKGSMSHRSFARLPELKKRMSYLHYQDLLVELSKEFPFRQNQSRLGYLGLQSYGTLQYHH